MVIRIIIIIIITIIISSSSSSRRRSSSSSSSSSSSAGGQDLAVALRDGLLPLGRLGAPLAWEIPRTMLLKRYR